MFYPLLFEPFSLFSFFRAKRARNFLISASQASLPVFLRRLQLHDSGAADTAVVELNRLKNATFALVAVTIEPTVTTGLIAASCR
jgi:hypothetical protein